jgi:hypothetical protein
MFKRPSMMRPAPAMGSGGNIPFIPGGPMMRPNPTMFGSGNILTESGEDIIKARMEKLKSVKQAVDDIVFETENMGNGVRITLTSTDSIVINTIKEVIDIKGEEFKFIQEEKGVNVKITASDTGAVFTFTTSDTTAVVMLQKLGDKLIKEFILPRPIMPQGFPRDQERSKNDN